MISCGYISVQLSQEGIKTGVRIYYTHKFICCVRHVLPQSPHCCVNARYFPGNKRHAEGQATALCLDLAKSVSSKAETTSFD